VFELSFIHFISGRILTVRSGLSTVKMWSGPPSTIKPARARERHLRGIILLVRITTLRTQAVKRKKNVMFKRHTPIERSSHLATCYSKKLKQPTINKNREDPVCDCNKQSCDPHFWSLFHSDCYRSIYLHKKMAVVETQWVNWVWMATRRHTIFNQIRATCDELEMTKMMSFKYDWVVI
jgi:hypothetical protein